MEFELEVTVHSMNRGPTLYYFEDLTEGLAYVARHYGHYDQWSVVITHVVKRDK